MTLCLEFLQRVWLRSLGFGCNVFWEGLSPFEGAVMSTDSSLEKLVACLGCVWFFRIQVAGDMGPLRCPFRWAAPGTLRVSRKIKGNFKRKKKTLFFLRLYTYKTLPSSSRDRTRVRPYNLFTFGHLFSHYPHYPVGVRDRCYASGTFYGRTVRP